jgi:hypothetical protein
VRRKTSRFVPDRTIRFQFGIPSQKPSDPVSKPMKTGPNWEKRKLCKLSVFNPFSIRFSLGLEPDTFRTRYMLWYTESKPGVPDKTEQVDFSAHLNSLSF